jgi:hypothetical protein
MLLRALTVTINPRDRGMNMARREDALLLPRGRGKGLRTFLSTASPVLFGGRPEEE